MHTVALEEFAGYAVRASPFVRGQLAVATAANYGIVGHGRLQCVMAGQGIATFTTSCGLYDCCWSERSPSVILAAGSDGSIRLYDLEAHTGGRPITVFNEHVGEVSSVEWNLVLKETFASSSWDGTVKVWAPERSSALLTLGTNTASRAYEARWAPHHASLLLSTNGDGTVTMWDPSVGTMPVAAFSCDGSEVLTADWNKYDANIFVTGSVDRAVRLWDVRHAQVPLHVQPAHDAAVRKLRFSPHTRSLLLSASYDTSVRLWDTAPNGILAGSAAAAPPWPPPASLALAAAERASPSALPAAVDSAPCSRDLHAGTWGAGSVGATGGACGSEPYGGFAQLNLFPHHDEFVMGLEWSLFEDGMAASCGWDRTLVVWKAA